MRLWGTDHVQQNAYAFLDISSNAYKTKQYKNKTLDIIGIEPMDFDDDDDNDDDQVINLEKWV